MQLRATLVGTATMLLEVGDVTFLTDPVFDPPGKTVGFGFGTRSRRLTGSALAADQLPRVDVALLSHDQHDDNLDDAGRGLLERAGVVVTTRAASRRLGFDAIGLRPFESHVVEKNGLKVHITAMPARHGPPLSLPLVGSVIGFLLEWEGQRDGAVYISGDTTCFGGMRAIARRARIGTAFLHMGGASFWTRALRFTMNASDAVRATRMLDPRRVVPIHIEGWTHFRDPVEGIAPAFQRAGFSNRLHMLRPGETEEWAA